MDLFWRPPRADANRRDVNVRRRLKRGLAFQPPGFSARQLRVYRRGQVAPGWWGATKSFGGSLKGDKRRAIVSSALELFARDGLHGVRLKDVAEHSGFMLGSLYHFFPEKKQLYNAAVREAALRFAAHMNEVLAEPGEPEARLRRFCWAMMETIYTGDPNMTLMDRAATEDRTSDFPGVMEGAATTIYEDLEKVLDEMSPEPGRGVSNRWLASYIISMIFGAGKLHRNHLVLQKLDSPAQVAAFLEGVVDFTIAALRSAPAR